MGHDGTSEQGKFYGVCLLEDCPWATPFVDTEAEAEALSVEHNCAFPDMPEGGTDRYGGRALQPWEEEYPVESQRDILYPGSRPHREVY